jgi:hypothetical protein
MSAAITPISGSSAVSYAMQLAQTSAVDRSLSNLGIAIQRGELVPASSILTAFFKANPQYTSTASDDSQSQDSLSQHFLALATAISNNQVDAAQTAWTQVESDLANNGVTNPGDGTASTSAVPAQTNDSTNEQFVRGMLGISSGGGASIAAFLGGSSSSQTGLSSSLIGNRLIYQQSGITGPPETVSSAGNLLNTAV